MNKFLVLLRTSKYYILTTGNYDIIKIDYDVIGDGGTHE